MGQQLQQWAVVSWYARFFQCIGFQPYGLENAKINQFLLLTVVQFLAVGTNLFLVTYDHRCILYTCESIGMVVDWVKVATIVSAYCVIYVELFRTRETVGSFWNRMHRIHLALEGRTMVNHRQLRRAQRCYWAFVVGSFIHVAASDGIYFATAASDRSKIFIKYLFWLQFVLHLKEHQLMYPSIVLNFYIRATHGWLQHHLHLLRYSEKLNSSRYTQFLIGRIQSLKLIHGDLYRCGVELNAAFGWTALAIYCKTYIQILSNSYWVVFWILNGQPHLSIKIASQLLVRMVFMSAMYYVNNAAMDAGRHFRYTLHKIDLKAQLDSTPNYIMVESFIRQANLERIKVTAADCIPMNFKPMLTIVVSICTYVSIFIQQAPTGERILECYHRPTC